MTAPVSVPLWMFILIMAFAGVSFATHFLFPSVRWFLRRRMERAVERLNARLERPIQPFKLLRRYDLIQRLVYDRDVLNAAVAHARETGVREDVAIERARGHAREIVPSFSALTYFGLGVRAARILSWALYDVRLATRSPEAFGGIEPDATVVFVMNHRSNMDYVLVTHLVAERSVLSYAVGEWARVWPLSWLVRAMGAYFIRRRDRDGLYRRVLRRYVQMSTEAGVTQAIFPEGGLSLTGGLVAPKKGLLSYLVEGYARSGRDLVFVPVALNYDRVLEDRLLVKAAEAGTRRFDARITRIMFSTLRQFAQRLTGRFKGHGIAAVAFGEPLSVRHAPDLATDPDALAVALMQRIAGIVPVLPVPLVALLLENGPRPEAALVSDAVAFLSALPQDHPHRPEDPAAAVRTGLAALGVRGIVQETGAGFALAEPQRALAAYYANSIRHLATAPTLVAAGT